MLFDFNGTLSDDEPILYSLYAELFAEQGRPLTRQQYVDRLAGLSEEAIFEAWLGAGNPAIPGLIAERIARYRLRAADGSTIPEPVRAAVRYAAARVPVGVVSGAAREEIAPVLRGAQLDRAVTFVVAADDVVDGKPHPEGYLHALERLGGLLDPSQVVAFEDTEAGVAAAKAAGLHVLAVPGTLSRARLEAADALVDAIDVSLLARLLG